MARHTSGPWHLEATGRPRLNGGGRSRAVRGGEHCPTCREPLHVCEIGGETMTPQDPAEVAANAALILAAPDLLAALKEAADLFGPDFCYDDGRVIFADQPTDLSAGGAWVLQARAAIAKAQGETASSAPETPS